MGSRVTIFKRVIVAIILFQITIIIFVVINFLFFNKKKEIYRVFHLDTKYYKIIPPSDNLNFFYEPQVNLILKDDPIFPYHSVYHFNGDTLNSLRDYSVKKQQNTYRIVAIGDSHTFGAWVMTKDNWPSQLEKMLNKSQLCNKYDKYEVINLGVGGYDTEYELERYKIRGTKYNPDLVIWLFVDLQRNLEVILKEYDQYIKQHSGLNLIEKYKALENIHLSFIDSVSRRDIYKRQSILLQQFRDFYSGNLIFVPQFTLSKEDKNFLKDFAVKAGRIMYVENLRDLSKLGRTFKNDGHPTAEGYKNMAEDIYSFLSHNRDNICNIGNM